MNLIGTPKVVQKASDYLKGEFEMKDLRKTKHCLGLQIEHSFNGSLFTNQLILKRFYKRFNIDKAYPQSTPIIIRSLDHKNDLFVLSNLMNRHLVLKYNI